MPTVENFCIYLFLDLLVDQLEGFERAWREASKARITCHQSLTESGLQQTTNEMARHIARGFSFFLENRVEILLI